jgi:hypothetical protein
VDAEAEAMLFDRKKNSSAKEMRPPMHFTIVFIEERYSQSRSLSNGLNTLEHTVEKLQAVIYAPSLRQRK